MAELDVKQLLSGTCLSSISPLSPLDSSEKFSGSHILSIIQFSRHDLDELLLVAGKMKLIVESVGMCDIARGSVMAVLFYESSTRTSSSFQVAMQRLGGQVLAINDISNSSVSKGETLEDTVKCLECYTNVIVLRHPELGAALRASKSLSTACLINAGDGVGEHPTQALLDLYTIQAELPAGRGLEGATITMLGDLKHGRTVHSLAKLLANYKNVKINYVSPEQLKMPKEIVEFVAEKSQGTIQQSEYSTLEKILQETDILYVTRIQRERFSQEIDYLAVANSYIITPQLLSQYGARSTLRILHPLPRVNEISPQLDSDPRAAYFRQMRYGLYVRMALLSWVLGKKLPENLGGTSNLNKGNYDTPQLASH
jgi:aspartate carbamoyltransferase